MKYWRCKLWLVLTVVLHWCSQAVAAPRLDVAQSKNFRAWFVRIVAQQLDMGPHARWHQRDCAGLVRFAANEALKPHDAAWLSNMQMSNRYLPPEIALTAEQRQLGQHWQQANGKTGPFVSAINLIYRNARAVTRDLNQAKPGDLLYFDQGDEQHLMICMGQYAAYHRGTSSETDNGLRRLRASELMQMQDTRWLADRSNPNFIGVFRLNFLAD